MLRDIIDECRSRILHYFPERQIYHRTGGEVHYFVLKTRTQVAIVSSLSLVALWCSLTILSVFWVNNPLRPPVKENKRMTALYERQLEDARARYENAQLIINQQRDAFESQTREFAEAQSTISQFVEGTGRAVSAPISDIKYASSRVLMAPTSRDPIPRKPRVDIRKAASLNVNVDIDPSVRRLKETQNAILADAEMETLDRIERSRAILSSTAIGVDTILKNGGFGEGGVFVPIEDGETILSDGEFGSRVGSIKARVAEADALDSALTSVPFGNPVGTDTYRTSGYGMRKDPFNKRPAFHAGIDFGAYRLAPIVATADGVVKFVGRNGGYGRTVEIDHGHGFVTRYAHLEKTYVKRGTRVKMGEKIGGMGSTGRSTATHLHYEIYFQGQDFDPDNFLKAGKYVQ